MDAGAAFDEGIKNFRKPDHFREDSKTNLIFHQLDDDHLPPLITRGSIQSKQTPRNKKLKDGAESYQGNLTVSIKLLCIDRLLIIYLGS